MLPATIFNPPVTINMPSFRFTSPTEYSDTDWNSVPMPVLKPMSMVWPSTSRVAPALVGYTSQRDTAPPLVRVP